MMTIMTNSRVNYKRLKSLKDLRAERLRIAREVYYKKAEILDDIEQVQELFTPDYWMGMLTRKVGNLTSTSGMLATGYDLVSSLIKKKRKKKARKRR